MDHTLLQIEDAKGWLKQEAGEHATCIRLACADHPPIRCPSYSNAAKALNVGWVLRSREYAGVFLCLVRVSTVVYGGYRRILSLNQKWRPYYAPKLKKRTALYAKLREIFRQHVSWPVEIVIAKINPVLRGWVNYFRYGQSSSCFSKVKQWVEMKIRKHLIRARGRNGFPWKQRSSEWLYDGLGLFNDYQLRMAGYCKPAINPVDRSSTFGVSRRSISTRMSSIIHV